MRKCTHCGSDTRMQVQAVVSAPSSLAHQFSKQNMRRKDVYFMGVMWETADYICTNHACNRVEDGYGNYVTGLAKRVDELEAECEKLKSIIHEDSCRVVQLSIEKDQLRQQLKMDSGNTSIGAAINRAAECLPEGYDIQITIEKDAGTVELYIPTQHGTIDFYDGDSFADYIQRAVSFAVEHNEKHFKKG